MDIKEEFLIPEVISNIQRESSSQDVAMSLNSDATVCNKMLKTKIKEQGTDSDLSAQNDWLCCSKDLITNFKQCQDYEIETKTKMNEDGLEFCPQNKMQFFCEDPVVTFNPCSKDSEPDAKTEAKEEMCLERSSMEAPCVDDWVDESFPSTESIRLYNEETFRNKSSLFPDEHLESNARFSIIQDCSDSGTARKYTSRKTIPEIYSVQKSVYSKQPASAKMVSLKYCDLVQQNKEQAQELIEKNCNYESDLLRNIVGDNYKCDICDTGFTLQSALKRHKLTHEGIKPHKCDTCGNCFTRLTHLKRHQLTHEGLKPHRCDTCGKCFTLLQNLKMHKLLHEGIKPHKCDTCGKCFTQLSNLKKHKFIHETIKPHKCDTCGKSYAVLTVLKRHKLTHEGIKPYRCDTCGKCFTGLTALKKHTLIHVGIKPHKCDTCGKCFTQLSTLKLHKLIHEGIMPHKCDTCGKCFRRSRSLKAHIFNHEGIKPYECNTCGNRFTKQTHLKRHKLIHEGIKSYRCDTCHSCFTYKSILRKHILTCEGIQQCN